MIARYAGRAESFLDGLGLCSPGRWRPFFRSQKMSHEKLKFANSIRSMVDKFCHSKIKDMAQQTFRLAHGRFKASPFSEEDPTVLRSRWFNLLPDPRQAGSLAHLAQSLRLLGDPTTMLVRASLMECTWGTPILWDQRLRFTGVERNLPLLPSTNTLGIPHHSTSTSTLLTTERIAVGG